ncbi:MAG: NUDIX hydrolase [Candidatus Saccharimonadales bacterium]
MKQAVRAIVTRGDDMLVMKRNKFGSEYYTLIGGAVEMGESLEDALRRELQEEAGVAVGRVRLVYVEDAGEPYGEQFVYLCEYESGEGVLSPESEEAQINKLGQNTYEPEWLPLETLTQINFVSGSLKEALLESFQHGYPEEPVLLAWKR